MYRNWEKTISELLYIYIYNENKIYIYIYNENKIYIYIYIYIYV